MAKIVAQMVARGYVERHPDAADNRVKRLRLGPRGRAALAAARRFHRTYEGDLDRKLGTKAVRALREALEEIARAGGNPSAAHARLRPM